MQIKLEYNCSDLLTKYWGYSIVWKRIIQPLFHYSGNRSNLMYDDTLQLTPLLMRKKYHL